MIAAPACTFILHDADRVAPGRNHATDGIFPDAAHLAQGVKSDHNPDANGVCHAVDVTNDPAHGMDTWVWAQTIAQRIIAGEEHRVKYLVSNAGGPDVIFNPSISLTWRQNGTYKTEHRSHLHTSILEGHENDLSPYFVGAGAPIPEEDELSAESETYIKDLHDALVQSKGPDNLPMVAGIWRNLFQGKGDTILTKEFRGEFAKIEERLTAIEQKLP